MERKRVRGSVLHFCGILENMDTEAAATQQVRLLIASSYIQLDNYPWANQIRAPNRPSANIRPNIC